MQQSIIWKLLMIAEKAWRSLKGSELLQDVYDGRKVLDGRIVKKAERGCRRIIVRKYVSDL
jgi:hypothetical protein